MSNLCPNCQSPIEAFFGIVNCPKCSRVLVVDIDGNIQTADEALFEPGPSESHPPHNSPDNSQSSDNHYNEPPSDSLGGALHDSSNLDTVLPVYEEPKSNVSYGTQTRTAQRQTATRQLSDVEMGVGPGGGDEPAHDPARTAVVTKNSGGKISAKQALKDIVDFANSPRSDAQEGIYFFDVHIKGIDSSALRESLKDCLLDRRMGWDPDQLMKQIRQGELTLSNLSAVKASVMISRLRELPFQVTWNQHSLMEPGT